MKPLKNALHAVFSFHKLAGIYGLLVLRTVALTYSPVAFQARRRTKTFVSVPLTQLVHVFPLLIILPEIIHLSLSAASPSQMCIARCRTAQQMFTGRRRHPREVKGLFNNEGPEDLLPGLATGRRMGGFTSRDRALCNDGR